MQSFITLSIFFVEFVTFILIWLFLLIGFFLNIKFITIKHLGKLSTFISSALTISLCFHLLKKFNEFKSVKAATVSAGPPLSCHNYLLGLLTLSSSCSSYFVAFNDNILWRLNPFIILCDWISEILIIFADTGGKVAGKFVASLLNELPWIYQLPALILLSISLFSTLFLLKNYNFRFFYGILDISKAKSPSPPPIPPHQSLPIPYSRTSSLKKCK